MGGGDILIAAAFEKDLGEIVVDREGDTDEERADEEDVKRGATELFKGIDAYDAAGGDFGTGSWRWCGGEREAVESEQQAGGGGHVERQGCFFCFDVGRYEAAEDKADGEAGNDPAYGAKHADERELFFLVFDVGEAHGVGKAHGRHVADVVGQQQEDEGGGVASGGGGKEHEQGTQDV